MNTQKLLPLLFLIFLSIIPVAYATDVDVNITSTEYINAEITVDSDIGNVTIIYNGDNLLQYNADLQNAFEIYVVQTYNEQKNQNNINDVNVRIDALIQYSDKWFTVAFENMDILLAAVQELNSTHISDTEDFYATLNLYAIEIVEIDTRVTTLESQILEKDAQIEALQLMYEEQSETVDSCIELLKTQQYTTALNKETARNELIVMFVVVTLLQFILTYIFLNRKNTSKNRR